MQQVGSGLPSGSQVASCCPSAALAAQNQVATLPVQLLRDDGAAVQDNVHAENGFQMKVDAHGFRPEELVVQVDGQRLKVMGQRQKESYSPDGVSYRMAQKVRRQVLLPPDLDPAAMTCFLTPSGHLCVQGQCRVLPPPEPPTGQSSRLRIRDSKMGSNPA
ncbi:heat shock protein beta-9 [Pteronotus mesoamericanus]|uniref:heat shock protein beta-9 n=1 Tax=Pteronotus mesoamericanus TaxID=1884717 RepID=UPI0023EBEA3F|nr:heat shock protein beta-9 [Pteronotus parnellii mesoamericanus]